MSITIRHIAGPEPLNGAVRDFATSVEQIVFGRSGECDVECLPECAWIAQKHLKLSRSETGRLQLEVLSDRSGVTVDGEAVTKADGAKEIASGSLVSFGEEGPAFKIETPAVTVRHLDGPLAGQVQTFDDSFETIDFGRKAKEVVYPPDYRIVGKNHFALERKGVGNYSLHLTHGHYVEIDGRPASDENTVKPRSTFRLGRPKGLFGLWGGEGPSFELSIEEPPRDTEINFQPKTWQQRHRELIAGLAVVAVLAAGAGGYQYYSETRIDAAVTALRPNIYLIVRDDGGVPKAEATAFVIGENVLATNAHVTQDMRGAWPGEYYLLGPNDNRVEIAEVESHPGYMAFEAKKRTYGVARHTHFQPLSLPSAYDVGLIWIEPAGAPLSEDPLDLASRDEVEDLDEASELVSAGFPLEGLKGSAGTPTAPSPTFGTGIVRKIVDIFQQKPAQPEDKSQDHGLIIVHDIPVAGGISGSPIVETWSGKVVGIISGGNVVPLTPDTQDTALGEKTAPQAHRM